MRLTIHILASIAALYLAANLLYFAKASVGIDLLPGHHGGALPLGDWLWQHTRRL